ncbi:hypothetical protein FJZ33_06770 [Candidatus Poribacteria bacterium]|nr:hypothetical protein [Candidatus Poribacteria bacterium]
MNGLERFMKALRREEPDRIPIWELIVNRPVIQALYGNISYRAMVKAARKYGQYPLDEKMVEEYRKKNYMELYL